MTLKLVNKCVVVVQNFYLIGRDENRSFRRILKIDRRDQNELNLFEDPTRYTKEEMRELKRRMIVGNEDSGGFKFFTTCYGIIGTSLYLPLCVVLSHCFGGQCIVLNLWSNVYSSGAGFVRFLEPYYMLVITKRKQVGEICGHTVYGIAESRMIVIPHPSIQTKVAKSEAEQRYFIDNSSNGYVIHMKILLCKLYQNTYPTCTRPSIIGTRSS